MVFREFRVQCIVRVVLILVALVLLVYVVPRRQPATIAVCGVLVLWQTWALVRYVETTNRSLASFLQSLKASEFSQCPSPGPAGRSFADLQDAFRQVLDQLRELGATREEGLRYLQTIVQHVPVGLLAYRPDGGVEMVNSALKSLLDIAALRRIEDLAPVSDALPDRIRSLEPGEPALLRVFVHGEPIELSLHATEIRQRQRTLTLVCLQNVSPELNEKEMAAWRDLIRVLTHEIRNSLTPLASLAGSVEETIRSGALSSEASEAQRAKTREALQIIQKRSRGLLQFMDTYRDLTHVPQPEYRLFPVRDLFSRVETLVAPQIEGRPVRVHTSVDPESMCLSADPQLVEQVLINLVGNALDAASGREDATITLEARFSERSRPVIRVTDNGPGIEPESLEKVFLPFYSTKKDGTGIGLSLSRQIMRVHRGDLTVQSEPGVRTTFTLRF